MKTLDEELQALEDSTRQKREAVIAKHTILNSGISAITTDYHEPFVHYSKLYGRVGMVSFQGTKYSSLSDGKNPDRALFAALLAKFPPSVPQIRVRDGGCVSFRPDLEENNTKGDIYDCHAITARVEVFQGPDVDFEWYTTINEQLWEINIRFPMHKCKNLGVLNARPRYMGEIVTSWERCDFHATAPAQVIRYASGGKQYPNHFTLYWDRDSGSQIDFPGMVDL